MKYDDYSCIIMEHVGFPGNVGDSCAETSRYKNLLMYTGRPQHLEPLQQFITDKGYVRHPDSPWREDDFSSDQALPLYLALKKFKHVSPAAEQMKARIKDAGWKTGNGDFISPLFYALLVENKTLLFIALMTQALLFKFPWRWNDEKHWFESTKGSSCDYLNWFHAALEIDSSKWRRRMISDDKLIEMVKHYYAGEPRSDWVVNQYIEAIRW